MKNKNQQNLLFKLFLILVMVNFNPPCLVDEERAKLISSTFGGGMGRLRQKCGAVTGGFMVLGLADGYANPSDRNTKLTCKKVRQLNQKIEDIHRTSNCPEVLKKQATEADVADGKHHKIICRRVASDATGIGYDRLGDEVTRNIWQSVISSMPGSAHRAGLSFNHNQRHVISAGLILPEGIDGVKNGVS